MTENNEKIPQKEGQERRKNAHPKYYSKKKGNKAEKENALPPQHEEKKVEKTDKKVDKTEKKVDKAEKKPDNKVQKGDLRPLLLRTVEQKNGALKKKDLFNVCLSRFALTAAEKRDHSPEGKLNVCRSVIGQAITELVAEGKIVIDADGVCCLPAPTALPDAETALKESMEKYIPQLFDGGKRLSKKEILESCVAAYPKAKTQSVRCEGGKALNALKENGKISQDKKTGSFYLEERFPNTPLGKTFRLAYEGGDVKKCFIDALNLSGGPFFEKFSVELLKKEFSSVGTVEKAEVTGGPDDGGIDGKIVYRDGLGFRETVLVQAKLRNVTKSETRYETGKQITLKEVREFFGAAVAAKGTRYVWITTTTFCKEAKSFIEKQPDFVGINKDKLYELAKKHGAGILTVDGKEELDYKAFQ